MQKACEMLPLSSALKQDGGSCGSNGAADVCSWKTETQRQAICSADERRLRRMYLTPERYCSIYFIL